MKPYHEAEIGVLRWLALFFKLCLTCGSVHAERRIALLIGNSAYKSVPPLANPVNDGTFVGCRSHPTAAAGVSQLRLVGLA
jgi:hypothetical protein